MSRERTPEFPGQRNDEHAVLVLRRHWFTFIAPLLQIIALNLLPIVVALVFVYGIGWELPTVGFWYTLGVVITSMYYVMVWLFFYHAFVDYHLDIWIVTDQRIINIEQGGLFDRVISELNLSKVQDVTSEIHGQFQTIFDFGTVHIQTAGEQQRFDFEEVGHPEEVARLVVRSADSATKREARLSSTPSDHEASTKAQPV